MRTSWGEPPGAGLAGISLRRGSLELAAVCEKSVGCGCFATKSPVAQGWLPTCCVADNDLKLLTVISLHLLSARIRRLCHRAWSQFL